MYTMKRKRIILIFNLLLIVVFFTLIWLPNIDSVFNIAPKLTQTEKRAIAQLPVTGDLEGSLCEILRKRCHPPRDRGQNRDWTRDIGRYG